MSGLPLSIPLFASLPSETLSAALPLAGIKRDRPQWGMILRIRPMTLTKATGVAAIPTLLLCL